ncbi:MAG: zinc dependent phospholipase C family protein [Clostridia bacterium]|nr:zinc dependent phospholipase C family protein [Clostridia bacterium]
MPAFATHYIFLEELKDEIEKQTGFTLDYKVAGVGTQGPDIFIFHRLWPPVAVYKSLFGVASQLHRGKPAELFEAFAEYLKASPNPHIARSFIYGFILHYALDRNCHPFVYAYQDMITETNKHIHPLAAHNQVEHAVDTYLLNKRKGIYPPSLFSPEETLTTDETELDEIGSVMQFVVKKCFNKDIAFSEARRAATDTANLQKVLSDKKGRAVKIAKAIETPLGPVAHYFKPSASIKPTNLLLCDRYANRWHHEWVSPYSKEKSAESFEDLFEKAKPDAIELIKGFDEIVRGEKTGYEVTGNISFLTGLEVTE